MTAKTPTPTTDASRLPPGGTPHRDSALESIGKAITDAMWESSGEADKSNKGLERRAAGHGTPHLKPPQD